MIAATPPPACYAKIAAYYAAYHGPGRFHTTVVTDGDYAFVSWSGGETGGETAFRHTGGRWCVLTNGGGAMDVDVLVQSGVPRATARRLFAKMQQTFHP